MQKIRRNWFSRIFKKHMASLICFFSCVQIEHYCLCWFWHQWKLMLYVFGKYNIDFLKLFYIIYSQISIVSEIQNYLFRILISKIRSGIWKSCKCINFIFTYVFSENFRLQQKQLVNTCYIDLSFGRTTLGLKTRFKKKLCSKKKLFLKSRSMHLLFQQEILENADNNIGDLFRKL